MQAQAERERQARVILGDSERQVAEKFDEAANTYADNPTAFHLRAMNMLYEGLKPATRRSSSCPRPRSSRCSSAACRDGDNRQRHRACTGRGGARAGGSARVSPRNRRHTVDPRGPRG